MYAGPVSWVRVINIGCEHAARTLPIGMALVGPSYTPLPSTLSAEPPPEIGLLSLLAVAPSGSSPAAANLFILVQLSAIAFAVWAIARYMRGKMARALTWGIARSVNDPHGHARRQLATWETDDPSLHEIRNILRNITARVRPHSLSCSSEPVDPEPADPEFETARNMLTESFGRRRRAPPAHTESTPPRAPLSIQLLGAVCPWYLTDWYQMASRRDSSRPDGESSTSTPSAAPSTPQVNLLEGERRKWAAADAARPQADVEKPSMPPRTPPPALPPRTQVDCSKNPGLPFFEPPEERGSPSFPQRLEAQQVLGPRAKHAGLPSAARLPPVRTSSEAGRLPAARLPPPSQLSNRNPNLSLIVDRNGTRTPLRTPQKAKAFAE